jgi:hypothetical protein
MSAGSCTSTPSAPTPPAINHFPIDNELKGFARFFIGERIRSLKKDVDHCLREPFAPFPAILYCLSTIELMGALKEGEASAHPSKSREYVDPCDGTTKQMGVNAPAINYMRDFMNYTDEQICLLMQLFRHKLVHLAQPKVIVKRNCKIVSWHYEHENRGKHLLLETAPKDTKVVVKSGWEIDVDQIFTISIRHLAEDIEDSVYEHGGYFDKFETDTILRDNFKNAIEAFYSTP